MAVDWEKIEWIEGGYKCWRARTGPLLWWDVWQARDSDTWCVAVNDATITQVVGEEEAKETVQRLQNALDKEGVITSGEMTMLQEEITREMAKDEASDASYLSGVASGMKALGERVLARWGG